MVGSTCDILTGAEVRSVLLFTLMLVDVKTRREYTELVIGLVGAIGAGLELVEEALTTSLTNVGFTVFPVRLSELLHEIDRWKDLTSANDCPAEEVRIREHMDAGDTLRELVESDDAMAVLGMGFIQKTRLQASGDRTIPRSKTAYILRSLKHREEVSCLREVYGPAFVLVGAYTPREERLESLSRRIAKSHNKVDPQAFASKAEDLINRDENDPNKSCGQDVRHAFPLSDVFVNSSNREQTLTEIDRFVELLFGNSLRSPTDDELCVAHAHIAGLRSAALGRQVGAAIATTEGRIVAAGTNEVPKFGGGQYGPETIPDNRDFKKGEDSSDVIARINLGEILDRLEQKGWLDSSLTRLKGDSRLKAALPIMEGTRLMQPMEFGRALHGEMAAILDCARRGVSLQGATLYVTTFPCHECARHIIGAGINRVVYIEPYPKSLAGTLYKDEIAVDAKPGIQGQLRFEPFVGVAPRRFAALFSMQDDRKDEYGNYSAWEPSKASLRLVGDPASYVNAEKAALVLLRSRMEKKHLKFVEDENARQRVDENDSGRSADGHRDVARVAEERNSSGDERSRAGGND
jgi:cytidine deaminase